MEEEVNLEGEGPEEIHPETLTQEIPLSIMNISSFVVGIVSSYGWFLLMGCILCFYIWKILHPKMERWKEAAEYHKNPDKFEAREMSVTSAREQMQQKYDELAKEHVEKRKMEEENRRANASRLPTVEGRCLDESQNKQTSENKPKSRLRPAYNPMMGDTSSCGWRPGGGGRRSGGG